LNISDGCNLFRGQRVLFDAETKSWSIFYRWSFLGSRVYCSLYYVIFPFLLAFFSWMRGFFGGGGKEEW
jgi:hypothetical protein